MPEMTQGARANANGKIGERLLVPMFEENGYTVVPWSRYRRKKAEFDQLDKLVVTQYPYTTIYEHDGKTEFLIRNLTLGRIIRVEVKWQQAAGSVDEKYPYVWLNAVYAYPEDEIVLVVDGGGYKPGAREWLVRACSDRWLLDDQPDKKVSVMTLAEFVAFFNKEMR